jgi:RNA polymerase sigma factor (sigma-70 family)
MATARSCSKHETLSEKELTNCVKAGDEAATGELFRRFWKFAYLRARAVSGGFPDLDAEDLAQESLSRAFKNIASYDPSRGTFSAYLNGIMRNILVDEIRAKYAQRRISKGQPDGQAQKSCAEVQHLAQEDLEKIADEKDWREIEERAWNLSQIASGTHRGPGPNARKTMLELISEALDKLPEEKQDMLRIKFLYYPDDIPSDELDKLEEAFGKSRGTMRHIIRRAMLEIKKYVLDNYDPTGPRRPQDNLTSDKSNEETDNSDERTNTDGQ